MHEFIAQYLPVIISSVTVAIATRRSVTRKLVAHAQQVNKVIEWALSQEKLPKK